MRKMFLDFSLTIYFPIIISVILIFSIAFDFHWQPGWCSCKTQLYGKTIIVTGATSGIGKETAKDLARRGARVIVACRNLQKAHEVLKEIESVAVSEVKIRHLDLSSMKSVRSFAETILKEEPQIDVLINNAGVIHSKQGTEDGFDIQWATNYLGPFLLTNLLLERIKSSAPSRIINVSSVVHRAGNIHWHDLNLKNRWYFFRSVALYYQTKLAQVLFTAELRRRLVGSGVAVYALHPGGVRTSFALNKLDLDGSLYILITKLIGLFFFKNTLAGSQTTIHCTVAEELQQQKNLYYSDCKPSTPHSLIHDEKICRKLWDKSESLVKRFNSFSNNYENRFEHKLDHNSL